MANEKQIKTKISLRYLDYITWSAESFKTEKPLKGEVWFCAVPAGNANATTAPTMLFKVGDGVNTFGNLKWGSALAADVYGWAKKQNLELVDLPDIPVVDTEDGNFVTDVEWDAANNQIIVHRGDAALSADLGNVSTLTTTAKTAVGAINEHDVEIGDLTQLNTTNKNNLVVAINEALQAVETGGTGSVVTIIKEDKTTYDEYTLKQGGNAIGDKIVVGKNSLTMKAGGGLSATEITFSSNDTNAPTFEVSHANTSEAANLVADGRKYVTGLTFDDYGHVTGYTIGEEVNQDLSGYKQVQGAVSDPTANGESLTFIDSISQNEQGVITPTKKTVKLSDYLKIADETAITITDKANTDTDDLVYAVSDLTEGGTKGHAITATYKPVATKTYVDKMAAGAVDYLGTVSALANLATDAGRGDFYRAAVEIKSGDTILAHAGDLLIAEKENPAQQIDGTNWSVIHGHEGRITEVVAGNGLTGGGSVGSVTISIDAEGVGTEELATNSVITEKILDKNVTEEKLEQDVQYALDLARTALQSHQDISGKADKVTGAVAGNFAGLDANGNLVDSGKKAEDFATKQALEALDERVGVIPESDPFNPTDNEIIATWIDAIGQQVGTNAGDISSLLEDFGELDEEISSEVVKDVQAGVGLTVTTEGHESGRGLTKTIAIDDEVVFVLDCNWTPEEEEVE